MIRRAYLAIALFCFNAALAFLALNLLAAPFAPAPEQARTGAERILKKYGRLVDKAYPHRSHKEIDALRKETWSRPLVFEPYTLLGERPYHGRYVNVEKAGFRRSKNQAPWPPRPTDSSIFVFGGSTTFGYGVADEETVVSALQERLLAAGRNVKTYNFGCAFYFSTQERIRFAELLARGHRPTLAVFVDGLNDFDFEPGKVQFEQRFRRSLEEPDQAAPSIARTLRELPLDRLMRHWMKSVRLGLARAKGAHPKKLHPPIQVHPGARRRPDEQVVEEVIRRYVANRRFISAMAAEMGVATLFVWQPVPTYHFDLSRRLFAKNDMGRHARSQLGYRRMAQRRSELWKDPDGLWLADIQPQVGGILYVDQIHYSPVLNRAMARAIAQHIVDHHLLSKRAGG